MTARLLHLTDFHFWRVVLNPLRLFNKRALGNVNVILRRRREFLMHQADAIADYVAGLGVADVFLGGDFTSTALKEEFALAERWVRDLRERGLRLHVVPGNHDVYTFEAHRNRRFEEMLAPYLPPGGYPCLQRLEGGQPLVLAPTAVPNWLSSRGRISPAQIARTCDLVRQCDEELVLVGAHYPVLEETPWFKTAKSRTLRGADDFRRALADTGKRIVYMCGHAHRFGFIHDSRYDNLTHLCTGALFLSRHASPERATFTEMHVDGDVVTVYLHRLMDKWRRDEVTVKRVAEV